MDERVNKTIGIWLAYTPRENQDEQKRRLFVLQTFFFEDSERSKSSSFNLQEGEAKEGSEEKIPDKEVTPVLSQEDARNRQGTRWGKQ